MIAQRLFLACVLWSGFAHSETINRCVDAAGKVSYSSTPCPAGASTAKALETKLAPPVSPPEGATYAPVPDYKQKEMEFKRRQQDREARDREDRAEIARMKTHEDNMRRMKDANENMERDWAGDQGRSLRSRMRNGM